MITAYKVSWFLIKNRSVSHETIVGNFCVLSLTVLRLLIHVCTLFRYSLPHSMVWVCRTAALGPWGDGRVHPKCGAWGCAPDLLNQCRPHCTVTKAPGFWCWSGRAVSAVPVKGLGGHRHVWALRECCRERKCPGVRGAGWWKSEQVRVEAWTED